MSLKPLLCLAAVGLGCSPPTDQAVDRGRAGLDAHGVLTTPEAARASVDDTLAKFDKAASDVLFRYLASNERWEVSKEGDKKYAVRREVVEGRLGTEPNGFYSTYRDNKVYQTRVLLTFGGEYGFGFEHGNVTRTKPGTADVPVVVEADGLGAPGYSSYLIVRGSTICLEIYDESPAIERVFTKTALAEVGKELTAVLAHQDVIRTSGVMPNPNFSLRPLPNGPSFDITDGFQPGIYQLSAFVNPTTPGYIETLVFGTASGRQLTAARERSLRYVGWSEDGSRYFPYNAEITVYESGWLGSTYEARFELWHTSNDGIRTKLGEKTRMISGWER